MQVPEVHLLCLRHSTGDLWREQGEQGEISRGRSMREWINHGPGDHVSTFDFTE